MDLLTLSPQKNLQFKLEVMDDEHLLYNPIQTRMIYLNSSAALVWQLCDGKTTISQIIEMLEASVQNDRSQIKSDILQLIDELVDNQVLEFL